MSESADGYGRGQQGAELTSKSDTSALEGNVLPIELERSRSSFKVVSKRLSQLQKAPTQELSHSLGNQGTKVWHVAKELDPFAVKEKKSTPVDVLCGGGTLLAILVFFIAEATHTFITSKPSITITETQATSSVQHPIPDIAITIGEDEPIIPLNESALLKYVTPSFTYRTYERYHEFGKVKTYTPLDFKFGASACGFEGKLVFQKPLVMCSLANVPSYDAIEKIKATDEHSKKLLGAKSIKRKTKVDNPTVQGKYDDDVWSFLEVQMILGLSNLSTLETEFFHDENGEQREFKLNVWFRFDREAWDSSGGLEPGEWDWFGFNRLPRPVPTSLEPARVGLDWNFWMKSNLAYVGPVHPIANSLHEVTAKAWLTYDAHDFDYKFDQWEEGSSVDFLEVGIKIGRQSRILNVTHPDLVDAVNFLGAGYNIAFFCGALWAGLLTTVFAMLCGNGENQKQDEEKTDDDACEEAAIIEPQEFTDKEYAMEEKVDDDSGNKDTFFVDQTITVEESAMEEPKSNEQKLINL